MPINCDDKLSFYCNHMTSVYWFARQTMPIKYQPHCQLCEIPFSGHIDKKRWFFCNKYKMRLLTCNCQVFWVSLQPISPSHSNLPKSQDRLLHLQHDPTSPDLLDFLNQRQLWLTVSHPSIWSHLIIHSSLPNLPKELHQKFDLYRLILNVYSSSFSLFNAELQRPIHRK